MFEETIFIERVICFILSLAIFILLRTRWHGPIKWLTISFLASTILFGIFCLFYFLPDFRFVGYEPSISVLSPYMYIFDLGIYAYVFIWTFCTFMFSLDLRKHKFLIKPTRGKHD
jgi:hypothetical protein